MAQIESFGRLLGRSDAMRRVFRVLEEVSSTDATVLIQGETGTGKELAAEAIHDHSRRSSGPYIVVDCAAIPEDLIEAELFGHVRGAFTSAQADREGAFEAASGGTIFIDEIGELPIELQSRILRVLEKREVKRIGANTHRSVDVRVLAATNRDLEREVAEGRFREDLYFRLNVVQVSLPPLRERPEDILFLAERFLATAPSPGGVPLSLPAEAAARLVSYRWPGNVRELRNIIDRGASISDKAFRVPDDLEQSLDLHDIDLRGSGVELSVEGRAPSALPSPAAVPVATTGSVTQPLWRGKTFKDAREAVLADFEQGYLTALLEEHRGNVSAAARAAGIHRNILHRMMARYGITR